MQEHTPIGLETRIQNLTEVLAPEEVLPWDAELVGGLAEALTRLESREALSFGEPGTPSALFVEISTESTVFWATSPEGKSKTVTVPNLGSWQEATEEAASVFGGEPVAWRLTESGCSVSMLTKRGERFEVEVAELAA